MANSYTTRLKKRLPAVGDENWDDEWHDNEKIDEVVLGALLSANRLISGGAVTVSTGLNVNYAALLALVAGAYYTITGSTVALTAAAPGLEQANWIYVADSGVVTVSTSPPSGDYVPLYRIDASDTAVIRVADLRPMIANSSIIGKNRIVNGSGRIDQLYSGTLITPATGAWVIDNVLFTASQASKLQSQQITNSALNTLGATHALKMSVLSSFTVGDTDSFTNSWLLGGDNIADMQWGTANAKAASLQFKALADIGGTYSGSICNAAGDRAYPFSFTLSAGIPTLVKIENIPGECCGVWPSDNTRSGLIVFDLGSGAPFRTTAGAWASGNYKGVTGAASLVGQAPGSALHISDVKFEEGSVCTRYEQKPFIQDLQECKKYYRQENIYTSMSFRYGTAGTTSMDAGSASFAEMNSVPTFTILSTPTYYNCSTAAVIGDKMSIGLRVTVTATGIFRAFSGLYAVSARL